MPIGEFAERGGVSVRMLRHYDKVGLLRPHTVDPVNKRRSYAADQLPRLNRIVILTSLGFSLRQVREIVDDELASAQLREVLFARRDDMRTRIEEDKAQLVSVEARIRALQDGARSTHDPAAAPFRLRPLAAARLAVLTEVVDVADAPISMLELFAEVERQLSAANVIRAGPRMSFRRTVGEGRVEVNVGVVIPDTADLPTSVVETHLPGVPLAACLTVSATVERADPDLRTIAWWVHDNRYQFRLDEPIREVYPNGDSDDFATGAVQQGTVELQLPVAPA